MIAEGNAFEGWPRDGSVGTLWARDARSGATIAVYASEPGYPNIVYGPGDMIGPDGKASAVLSSDFPNYADSYIERRLGGVAGLEPTIEGVSQAARVSSTGACVADPLGPCPLPPAPMGGFHWSFGDGTGTTTPPQVFARAWFSSFLHHSYRRPGTYQLTVSASDQNGQSDSMTLPIHVFPALRVSIVRHGRRAVARISGGDEGSLYIRWSVDGRAAGAGREIAGPRHARLRVTVSDAAGGIATASRR